MGKGRQSTYLVLNESNQAVSWFRCQWFDVVLQEGTAVYAVTSICWWQIAQWSGKKVKIIETLKFNQYTYKYLQITKNKGVCHKSGYSHEPWGFDVVGVLLFFLSNQHTVILISQKNVLQKQTLQIIEI